MQNNRLIFINKVRSMPQKRDTLTALDWIEKNRSTFKAEVLGPLGMYVQVNNPVCLAMVEKAIPFHVMTSCFIAQNEHEANILRTESHRSSDLSRCNSSLFMSKS